MNRLHQFLHVNTSVHHFISHHHAVWLTCCAFVQKNLVWFSTLSLRLIYDLIWVRLIAETIYLSISKTQKTYVSHCTRRVFILPPRGLNSQVEIYLTWWKHHSCRVHLKFGHLWDMLLDSIDLICNDRYYLIELTNTEAAILCNLHKLWMFSVMLLLWSNSPKVWIYPEQTPHSSFLNCAFKNV